MTSANQLFNGDATHAGLMQIIAERNQADLGGSGLGRLLVGVTAGSTVDVTEDAVSPFGFKLAGVSTTITGAVLAQPSGSPPQELINLGAATPVAGDTVAFNLNFPDGTSQTLTLTATSSTTPGADQFTIGATPALTAGNLQAALTSSLSTLATTSLSAASAIAAANNFFNADAANPPQRVAGPPFETATALGRRHQRQYGDMVQRRCRQQCGASDRGGPRRLVDFRVLWNARERAGISQRACQYCGVRRDVILGKRPECFSALPGARATGQQQSRSAAKRAEDSDVEAELAGAQTAIAAAKNRHQQSSQAMTDMLQSVQGVDGNEVGAKILTLQTQLQASLQTTVLLAHTSLVNLL